MLGQILMQRPPERHVDDLETAADGEQRDMAPGGFEDESDLEGVGVGTHPVERVGLRRLAVGVGVDIATTGDHQTVTTVEQDRHIHRITMGKYHR